MQVCDGVVNLSSRERELISMYIGNNQDWLEYCHDVFAQVGWIDTIERDMRELGATDDDIEHDMDGMIDLVSNGYEAFHEMEGN